MIVLPVGIPWGLWAAQLLIDFPTSNVPIPPPEDGWRDWAERLQSVNTSLSDAPRPDAFPDWRDWAAALIRAVEQ